MSETIQQFNVEHQKREDRLIFRVLSGDNCEIRVWLTRRYTKLLLHALDRVVGGVTGAEREGLESREQAPRSQQIRSFEREAALSNTNFSESYRGTEATALPLGEAPLLVSRIDIKDHWCPNV